MMSLTVAIPTFDRSSILLETINGLLDEPGQESEVVVLDDCSPEPASETLM